VANYGNGQLEATGGGVIPFVTRIETKYTEVLDFQGNAILGTLEH